MIDTLYIEQTVQDHPRTLALLARYPRASRVVCDHYGEIFNRKQQNFRLQKQRPALIVAARRKGRVLPAPAEYAVGARSNYYFSHLLNCPYDCRYCFLQGMYRSAHYVWFVNYEAFLADIRDLAGRATGDAWFFSGYDCDSLALDPLTGFTGAFLPLFDQLPNAWLELRTKSTQVRGLLARAPQERVVVAFSFTPEVMGGALEQGVPALARRLQAARALADAGWRIGLRFDPLVYAVDYQACYRALFARVFAELPAGSLHSVSFGTLRMPKDYFRRIERLYPAEPLLATLQASREGLVSYGTEREDDMMAWVQGELLRYLPANRLFPCQPVAA